MSRAMRQKFDESGFACRKEHETSQRWSRPKKILSKQISKVNEMNHQDYFLHFDRIDFYWNALKLFLDISVLACLQTPSLIWLMSSVGGKNTKYLHWRMMNQTSDSGWHFINFHYGKTTGIQGGSEEMLPPIPPFNQRWLIQHNFSPVALFWKSVIRIY